MKLKQKICNLLDSDNGYDNELLASKIAEEAEVFTVDFFEWLYKWGNVRLNNGNWIINLSFRAYTIKEAVEIYRKQKGL